eukprot:4978216-Pleurochrysis_carterae.AAC.1
MNFPECAGNAGQVANHQPLEAKPNKAALARRDRIATDSHSRGDVSPLAFVVAALQQRTALLALPLLVWLQPLLVGASSQVPKMLLGHLLLFSTLVLLLTFTRRVAGWVKLRHGPGSSWSRKLLPLLLLEGLPSTAAFRTSWPAPRARSHTSPAAFSSFFATTDLSTFRTSLGYPFSVGTAAAFASPLTRSNHFPAHAPPSFPSSLPSPPPSSRPSSPSSSLRSLPSFP